MKTFKLTDAWISTGLIVYFTIHVLCNKSLIYLWLGYFIVGGWQVISMLIHAINGWFTSKSGARYAYHWISAISLILMPVGFAYILLFTAPFMAVYYTFLCFNEVYSKMKRPLASFK